MRKSTYGIDALRKRTERIISLPREEFQKLPPADTQGILGDLLFGLIELETGNERLRSAQVELEESRRQSAEPS